MGQTADDGMAAAQAELARLNEHLLQLEAERASASERADQAGDTEEQAADVALAEQELERLDEQIAGAEEDWRRAQDDFDRFAYGEDEDSEDTSEGLSVEDAADIWMSNGMDEDYRFGYSEEGLRRAAEG